MSEYILPSSSIKLGSGGVTVSSGSADPSSSATSGNPGDLYLSSSTGKAYVKQDGGTSTNWTEAGAGESAAYEPPNSKLLLTGNSGVGEFANTGSADTVILRWSATEDSVGTDLTYTPSSTNGDSITINTAGIYAIVFTWAPGSDDCHFGLSLNQSDITDHMTDLSAANKIGYAYGGNLLPDALNSPSVTLTVFRTFSANDVIRALSDRGRSNDVNIPRLEITRIT